MPKKNNRAASGAGSIRQRSDGRWEARYTADRDPGTGKQVQKSIYGASQKEVLEKLRGVQVAYDNGTHVEPSKLTVKAWLDIWTADYLGHLKQGTQASYRAVVENHIKPNMGALKLQQVKPHQIQGFYNSLQMAGKSPKTIKNVHGVFHAAMKRAVDVGYLRTNPTEACTLPRWVKKEMKVLDTDTAAQFLKAIQGDSYEAIYYVVLFTGLRQAEILGLTWAGVDFTGGTITIGQQLVKEKKRQGKYYLDTTKSDNVRTIRPAVDIMNKLREQKRRQTEWQLKAGPAWENTLNLVFTNELGQHLVQRTVVKHYNTTTNTKNMIY